MRRENALSVTMISGSDAMCVINILTWGALFARNAEIDVYLAECRVAYQ